MKRLSLSVLAAAAFVSLGSYARAQAPASGSWQTFGNGPSHTGYYPATLGDAFFVAGWVKDVTVPINQAIVYGPHVFYTTNGNNTEDMHVACLDEATGNQVWKYPLRKAYSINPPTYSEGNIYFQRAKDSTDVPQLFPSKPVPAS